MRNLAGDIENVLRAGCGLADEFHPEARLLANRQTIRECLGDYAPCLMFFGTYNSGKSTLLNALLNTQEAATSDAPCTAVVEIHELGDYTVYDTPGIDAPIEHERVSRDHLKACHAVCFVLSTHGQFDEAGVVNEIAEVYRSGKALVLVLNNKSGATVESGELESICTKLYDNCVAVTKDEMFNARVPLLMVNARTAERARENQDENLLSMSGVLELERTLLRSLSAMNQCQLLLVPLSQVEDGLVELETNLRQRDTHSQNRVVDALAHKVGDLKRDVVSSAAVDIRELRNALVQGLIRAAHDGKDLETSLKDYLTQVQQRVERNVEAACRELELASEDEQKLAEIVFQNEQRDPGLSAGDEASDNKFEVLTPEVQKQIKHFVGSPQAEDLVKKGLIQLRKLKVPGIKGRWERTLGKWSGKLTKGLGWFIEVALLVYSLRKAYEAQKRVEAEMARREKELHEKAKQMAIDCEFEVIDQLPAIADETFGEFETQLREQRELATDEQRQVAQWLDEVRAMQQELAQVRAAIQAASS